MSKMEEDDCESDKENNTLPEPTQRDRVSHGSEKGCNTSRIVEFFQ